ncbi:nickel-dependent hydrogenase, large subunit [Nautilia profundicola AmH]|uniref:Nickel-dependent hydrogenase, large subunit n=1 Tax=Nautilia profundicola (strain ATCC BAA-1463 / DSM 18972 / AmH) TaxID=598659 RepID=B9L8N1_NAUPA|nr:nickel-dependent hydrogenase large subunit [Nautilia profundicola]ACM92065.1 nickel-dependent hydrogenase, large subunit [Nautilia profundicola AmH]
MKINKKIINKIEGEATLKIEGDKKIDFVQIEFWQYHGIEEYLKNKNYMDALVINPRVCGICGHSHLHATVKVIEKVFKAKISKKAQIFREVTSLLEIVENHIKWFYITIYPTQIKDKEYLFKAVKFSSKISKAIAILAGQFPHNSYMVPGGVTCDPTYMEIMRLKDLIKEIKEEYIKEIMDENLTSHDLERFFENLPKDIGKSLNKFLVLGESNIFKSNGDYKNVKEERNKSLSKNALYNNEYYEVGPLARMIINKNKNIKKIYDIYSDSIYTRMCARIYEPLLLLDYIEQKLSEVDLCEPSFLKPNVRNGKAIVAVEAPRGSLIHEISIKNEKIDYYNIVVPTQFNLASSTKENPSPAQAALMNEDIAYVDSVFRCFDICAVCMSH